MPIHMSRPCRFFLFDLDGTLIDSKADIAKALNAALVQMGYSALPMSRVADFVGDGAQRLVQRSLSEAAGTQPENEKIQAVLRLYLKEY
ncbi:MAG TPA: HAD hydrolase-like protein, partial [Acidobacteriota bacterium]|nr:HAD hydrolase-like protein [Acidobacteriota bacterium]